MPLGRETISGQGAPLEEKGRPTDAHEESMTIKFATLNCW